MEIHLCGTVADDAHALLRELKLSWEDGFKRNGYCLEQEGELLPITADSIEETPYGRVLKVLAAMHNEPDWRALLPDSVRPGGFHD